MLLQNTGSLATALLRPKPKGAIVVAECGEEQAAGAEKALSVMVNEAALAQDASIVVAIACSLACVHFELQAPL
eukprot:3226110-Amphidinium_carterae.1